MLNQSKRVKRTSLERVYRVRIANMKLLARNYDTLTRFAAALGVSPGHLSHIMGDNPKKAIGESAARDYEAKLGLHVNWLDTPHGGA